MSRYSRIQESTSSTSTSTITLAGAVSGFRTFASKHTVGETGIEVVIADASGNWLEGVYTLTNSTTLTRTAILGSSNSDGDVTLVAGTKNLFETISATAINKLQTTNNVAASTTIPLSQVGVTYMAQQNVTGNITLVIGANPVQGALLYTAYVANGTNTITPPSGFKEWGGSMGYDNRAGIKNQLQLFCDGSDYWYSWSQAVGAVAVDAIAPTASSAAVANATPTFVDITFSEAMDQGFVPAIGTVVASGHTTSALAWLNATVLRATQTAAFVNGEAARSLVITPDGTNNLRDVAGNQITTTQTISTITNNVAAPATVPATMAAPTATAGMLSASIAFVVPANGGAAITGYTVTASTGQTATGTVNPISITMPAGGTPTFTIHATNSVGNGAESPPSNAVTPSAAATAPATMAAPVATAGDTTASVVMTAPSDGGSAITGYTVTSIPAGMTDTNAGTTALTHAMTGGTNGTAYTFTASATNAVGTSAASPASNSVTPAAAGGTDTLVALTNLAGGLTMSSAGEYTGGAAAYDGATAGRGQAGVLKIPSGQAGRVSFDWSSATNCLLMLDDVSGTYNVSNALFALWMYVPNTGIQYSSNAASGSGAVLYKAPAAGLRYSLKKTAAGVVTIEESTDSGATWAVLYTFTTTWATGDLYPTWLGATIHQPRSSGLA